MSEQNNTAPVATEPAPVATESSAKPAAEGTNGSAKKKKGAGALLAEVQKDPAPPRKGKAAGQSAGGKKGGKKDKATPNAEEPQEAEEPEGPKVTLDPFNLPEPTIKFIPRKELVLEKTLQHRAQLQDIKEGGAVDQYAEKMREEGVEKVPALDVIEDTDDKGRPVYWLYDGFQRVGAYSMVGQKEVKCSVLKGNYADALLLSLKANSENSVIPRTRDDARRSVFAVLDNPAVLESVYALAPGKGGIHRTIARMCGCSTGTVTNALNARGLKPSGNKLIKAKPKQEKPKPVPQPDPALRIGATTTPEVTAAQQRKVDNEEFNRMCGYPDDRLIDGAKKCVKQLGAIAARYVTDDNTSTAFRKAMSAAGFPIATSFDREAAKEGKDFQPYNAILEHWQVLDKLMNAFDTAEKEIAELRAKENEDLIAAQAAK